MKFLVKKQQIDCIERDKLADGQIAFVSFRFVFDNEWEGLYKVVQFMQGENTRCRQYRNRNGDNLSNHTASSVSFTSFVSFSSFTS
jgi:hypothetical protein